MADKRKWWGALDRDPNAKPLDKKTQDEVERIMSGQSLYKDPGQGLLGGSVGSNLGTFTSSQASKHNDSIDADSMMKRMVEMQSQIDAQRQMSAAAQQAAHHIEQQRMTAAKDPNWRANMMSQVAMTPDQLNQMMQQQGSTFVPPHLHKPLVFGPDTTVVDTYPVFDDDPQFSPTWRTSHPHQVMHIDFETRSVADLKKEGAWKYAQHATTDLILIRYSFDDLNMVYEWNPLMHPCPQVIKNHVDAGKVIAAWNVGFEFAIWKFILSKKYGWPMPMLEQFHDSMIVAAYRGLPLSLDKASERLHSEGRIKQVKDKDGRAVMTRMARPRSVDTSGFGPPVYVWWNDDPQEHEKLKILNDYCETDVRVERSIDQVLAPLPETERDTWLLDQKINQTGVRIDRGLVIELQKQARLAVDAMTKELSILTAGAVTSPNQIAKMLEWLKVQHNIALPDLRKDTVADALKTLASPVTQGHAIPSRVLEIRQECSKSSVKKLDAMLDCADKDGRIRGMFQFAGAHTLRWAGRLVQLQNLPQPDKCFEDDKGNSRMEEAAAQFLNHMTHNPTELVDPASFGFPVSPMAFISSMLRGCLIPSPGHTFVCVDYGQIEARVCAWVAGQMDVLDVFRRGEDLYLYTAVRLGKPGERPLGKVSSLALQYGMGANVFLTTAEKFGFDFTPMEAGNIVDGWRRANGMIVMFWREIEAAFRQAMMFEQGRPDYNKAVSPVYTAQGSAGNIKIRRRDGNIVCQLPSGRLMTYRNCRLTQGKFGEEIIFDGRLGPSKLWGGTLTENFVQAIARDLLAYHMRQLGRMGYRIVMHVHDELVVEISDKQDPARVQSDLEFICSQPPEWAKELPMSADGWHGKRYRK